MGLSQQGGGLSPDGPLWSSTIVKKLNLQLANWRSTLIPGPIVELREHPRMYNPLEVDGFKRLTASTNATIFSFNFSWSKEILPIGAWSVYQP